MKFCSRNLFRIKYDSNKQNINFCWCEKASRDKNRNHYMIENDKNIRKESCVAHSGSSFYDKILFFFFHFQMPLQTTLFIEYKQSFRIIAYRRVILIEFWWQPSLYTITMTMTVISVKFIFFFTALQFYKLPNFLVKIISANNK